MTDDITPAPPAPTAIIPMGDAALVVAGLKPEFPYTGKLGKYEVYSFNGEPLFDCDTYRLVLAKLPSGQLALVKMSAAPEYNFAIEQETEFLRMLQGVAKDLDDEADKNDETGPHYGAWFPMPIEALTTEDNREGIFLGYDPSIANYKQLKPISLVAETSRIDMQTGVWVLGKLLKFLAFVHSMGQSVNYVGPTNVFVEPDMHGVFVLNLSEVGKADPESCTADVVAAAKMVWEFCGGTDTTDAPHDPAIMSAEMYAKWVAFYKKMMAGEMLAEPARLSVYALADETWPHVEITSGVNKGKDQRPFYKWVVYPKILSKES